MKQDCRGLLVWAKEQLDWVYFRSETTERSHMQVNTMEAITSLLLNGTKSSLNVWQFECEGNIHSCENMVRVSKS